MGDFYGTGIEIWAGFGPIGITEKKKIWANYEQLLKTSFFVQKKKVEISEKFDATKRRFRKP